MLKNKQTLRRFSNARTVLAALMLAVLVGGAAVVHADQFTHQIQVLNADNAGRNAKVDDLQAQASSYQDAINKLQGQISAIQNALAANEAEQSKLQQEITADKHKIQVQKGYLSEDIRTMYVDGQLSTIEELATSKNLSDYVDKEEYRTAIQNKVDSTIQEIAALQEKLQAQKVEVDQLINTQKQQQAKLGADRAEQSRLLGYNQGQQNQYNSQIKANSGKIAALKAEQARLIAESSRTVSGIAPSGGSGGSCDIGMGNGGYPMAWCNAGQDSVVTSGGFPNRECTSFAYWYFTSVEGKPLSVYGDAKNWVYTSNRPVTQTPHVGDIFVNTLGTWGHVGIVVSIDGGWVRTISMNDDLAGHFYNTREYPAGSLYYIH